MALAFPPSYDPSKYYTDEELLELSSHSALRFERDARGKLLVSPPAGAWTGKRNAALIFQLELWNRRCKLGEVFDSSAGFRFPDGSVLAPDAAWVEASRWQRLAPQERERYAPLCPDVIFELTSPTDRLGAVRKKMRAYIRNGARLGVLIAVTARAVELYRPRADGKRGHALQTHAALRSLPLEPELPGFILDLEPLNLPRR